VLKLKKRYLLVPTLTLLSVYYLASAQEKSSNAPLKTSVRTEQIATKLEQVIPPLIAEGRIPGLSIALVRNGELAWYRGFGVKNSQTKEPVAENTIFEAASLSKPVFAYAVLKLVDAGKLNLDTPLTKYLPGRYDVGDDARLDQITARHVLSHTPGFPNWRRPENGPLPIYFTPGDRFSYSGEGFVYLSKVVEHLTGETFENFMKKTVFEPLRMISSSYLWRDEYEARKTFRHNSVSNPTGQNRPPRANAAASLHTTAEDYGRFVAAILKGTGLKQETLKQMLTPQIKVSESGTNNTAVPPQKLSPTISWGLGWGLQTTNDGVSFWHWGDNGDAKAYVVGFEKQKLGVVVFANSTNGLSIMREIIDEAVGGEQPALAWLKYESYRSPSKMLLNKILAGSAETVLRDYREARKSRPAGEILNEAQMNRLGYDLIGLKRVKDAIEVFKFNVEDYPKSANVYDSLGEAYMINGERELAIKNYERSLELNPNNTDGAEALKRLRAQR
jgi:CubicO group peptidase (beta-lactamase class C family)